MSVILLLCFSMEEHNQKDRLEQELRFLKESYEADVISKEEFEKGKDRVEKKLKEIEQGQAETKPEEQIPLENENLQVKDEISENPGAEEEKPEPMPVLEGVKETGAKEEDEHKYTKPKEGKAFRYAVVFVIFILAAFFTYSLLSNNSGKTPSDNTASQFTAACDSDDDCVNDKAHGTCMNSGTKESKCEYAKKTKVVVLNDMEDCFNCGTARVLSIIEGWFGDVDVQHIDYDAQEGRELADAIGARMLHAYVIYGNISSDPEFQKFRRAFVSKGDAYVLSEDASASTLYFRRELVPNKLDLFAKEGESATMKAENNLKEFLENFPDINFSIHYSDEPLTKELGIRTFPTFLINNRVKFSGIHPADTIKSNFCSLNKAEECKKELSRNII